MTLFFTERFGRSSRSVNSNFLTHTSFHNNWHSSFIDDIEDIADGWNNAQHEFVDKKLNELLAEVKTLSREFARIENYGFNVRPDHLVRIQDERGSG
jgi:hypothetical protein